LGNLVRLKQDRITLLPFMRHDRSLLETLVRARPLLDHAPADL